MSRRAASVAILAAAGLAAGGWVRADPRAVLLLASVALLALAAWLADEALRRH